MSRLSNRLLNLACRKTNWRYHRLSTFHHCRQQVTENHSDHKALANNNVPPTFCADFSLKPSASPTSFDALKDPSKVNIGSPEYKQHLLDHRLWLIENDIRRFNRVDPHSFNEYCQIMKEHRTASSTAVLTLINACGTYMHMVPSAKRIEMLEDLWTTLKSIGFALDISHYNNLLSAYLENYHDFVPIDFLTRLEKEKIEPNRITFQRLLQRFAQMGDLTGVGTILEYMRGLDIAVTEHVCNLLLYANVKAKNEPELEAVIQFMTKNNMDITSDSYFQIMCGHAENNNLDAVEEVLNANSQIVFSDKQILHVIYLFARNNNHNATDVLLQKIRKTPGYLHDAINAALRINALGAIKSAVSILCTVHNEANMVGTEGVGAGGPLLNQAVDLNFTDQQVLELCNLLKENGVNSRPYELTYTVAAQASRKDLAMYMMQRMIQENQPPLNDRPHCFWPLFLMTARNGDGPGLSAVAELAQRANAAVDVQTLTEWVWPAWLEKMDSDGNAPSKSSNMDAHLGVISEMRRLLSGRLVGSDNIVFVSYICQYMLTANVPVVKMLMNHFNTDIHISEYSIDKFAVYIRLTNDTATILKRVATFIKEGYVPMTRREWLVNEFLTLLLRYLHPDQHARLVDDLYEYKIPFSDATRDRYVYILDKKLGVPMDVKKIHALREIHDTAYALDKVNRRTQIDAQVPSGPIDQVSPSEFPAFLASADKYNLNCSLRRILSTDYPKGVKLLRVMGESNKPPYPVTYFYASRVSLRENNIDNALEFYHKGYDIKSSNFVPEPCSQLQLLIELLDRNRIDDFIKCVRRWSDSLSITHQKDSNAAQQETDDNKSLVIPFPPHFISLAENFITTLFQHVTEPKPGATQVDAAVALQIAENLLDSHSFGLEANMFTNALKYLLDKNHVDLARNIFETILKKTNKVVYGTEMLRALVLKNEVDKLQQTYNLMASKMTEGTATLRLAIALAACDKQREAIKLVSVSSIRITKQMYEKEIKWALSRNDDVSLSAILTCLRSDYTSLKELAYKNLLLLYRIRSNFAATKELYLRMQDENYVPTPQIQQLLDEMNQAETRRSSKQPRLSASTLLNLLKDCKVATEASSSTTGTQRTVESAEATTSQSENIVVPDENTLKQQCDVVASQ